MTRRFLLLLIAVFVAVIPLTAPAAADETPPLKIVTFGTSLTFRGGWQAPLQQALQECLGRPVDVSVVARSGVTSDWAVDWVQDVIALHPDVVLVEFYANDAALNRAIFPQTSADNLRLVLQTLKLNRPRARLFTMIMNPIHGPRAWARPFLDSYIGAHIAVSESLDVPVIDHRPAWAQLSPEELEAAIPDGSHPEPAVAASVMMPGLLAALAPDCDTPIVTGSQRTQN